VIQYRKWLRRLLLLMGELLVVVVVMLGMEWWMTRDVTRGVEIELNALTTDGSQFNLQQWQGRSGVVYFWADWCPVCRVNRPVINAIASDYPVISVAMQSGDSAAVAAYQHKEGAHFPAIADPQGVISRQFHVKGVPLALIVDRQRRVRYVARGYTTELGLRTRLWLASWH